jgi:hypothetical protein
MSNQTNNAGIAEDQIRQLETQLASAFNEKIDLAYAESYEKCDEYYAPVRVPGVFSYAIKEAYVKVGFYREETFPDIIAAVIDLSYNHYRGSNGTYLGHATLGSERTKWELNWEKDGY